MTVMGRELVVLPHRAVNGRGHCVQVLLAHNASRTARNKAGDVADWDVKGLHKERASGPDSKGHGPSAPKARDMAKAEASYVPQLDGLRTLAFFLVFCSHLTLPTVMVSNSSFWRQLQDTMEWGFAGVDVFFVLSSYLITTLLLTERQAYGRINFRLFFLRRLLRIWPLYFLNLFLAFFVLPSIPMPTWTPHTGTPEWRAMVGTLLAPYAVFLGNFTCPPPVPQIDQMNHIWSVCIEEQFYLTWCALLILMKRTRTQIGFLIACQLGTMLFRAYQITHTNDFRYFYCNTFSHLDPMVMGALLAILLHRKLLDPQRLRGLGPWLLAGSLGLALFVVAFCPPIRLNQLSAVYVMTLLALAALLLLIALLAWPPAARVFSHPVLARPGKITYGMYVFHVMAIDLGSLALYLWVMRNPGQMPGADAVAVKFVVSLAVTLVLAQLSWVLLEKRCNDLRHKLSRVVIR